MLERMKEDEREKTSILFEIIFFFFVENEKEVQINIYDFEM